MKNNLKTGLSSIEIAISRDKNGSNELIKHKKNNFLKLLIESFNDPIIKILLIALSIKLVFLFRNTDIYETIGILIAIFLASFISSISEYGSEKAFEKLDTENSKIRCRVKRNNEKQSITIDEVVVGDVVLLESGDKIPADGIIMEGEISVDESSLTGETAEKYKRYDGDKKVFRGSIVTSKSGIMVVTKVGNETFYGSLSISVQEKSPESPLKQRLRHLAKQISRIGYIGAFLVSFSYLFNVILIENNFEIDKITSMFSNINLILPHIFYALTLAVTIIIVAVPEGLPMMITLVLSSNMNKMIKNNVLVRKLVGIETAGSLNILFTDKTGTLTIGNLKVVKFITSFNKEITSVKELIKYEKYEEIVKLSMVYNNASYFTADGKIMGGNITDRAILEFITNDDKSKYKIIDSFPFDSKNKYSSVTIDYNLNTTFFKGAYEVILEKCFWYYDEEGNKQKIDKYRFINTIKKYTKSGIRILAIASGSTKNLFNLTLIGFVLIKDEIRKDAKRGVELVENAGINVVMLTGDAKETAQAVAKEIGLIKNSNDLIITSEELSKMTDEEIKLKLFNIKVVSRSLPLDKNRLICLSQELDLVVGMTGDGVNDAPALKRANVGFAMGSGTEVAKEVSDIIILDDNFLSISKAILFGRTIFKSIRKFIIFQLTVNICAVTLSVIGPFIGVIDPVTVIQMLWINMVMDSLAALAFAYEPPLIEYMKEKPKKKNEPIVNKYMKNSIIFSGFYSSILCILFLKSEIVHNIYRIDNNDKYLMTAFFGLFIFLAIFNAFNARTYRINILSNIIKNKAFLTVISFIIIIQILLIYYGGTIFRTTGLTCYEFEFMIIIAFTIIPVDFIRKIILSYGGYERGV